jgi:ferric-dicitrate binding protein FerR (iron transport regulator)
MKKTVKIILFLSAVWYAGAQTTEARFLEFSGTVEVKEASASTWRPAVQQEVIKRDTAISTGFKSIALISLGGNSRLMVQPLTRLSLEELLQRDGREEVLLYLRSGRVRAEVTPPAGGKTSFTVRSPMATASVRGTAFRFDTRRLQVDSGTVRLSNNKGQRVYVPEGRQSYIDESDRRAVPSFEAGNSLLTPFLPELTRTGSSSGSVNIQTPETETISAYFGMDVEWP